MRNPRFSPAGALAMVLWVCAAGGAPAVAAEAAAPPLFDRFFALDTGTRDAKHQTAESQAAMLKDLGYRGIAPIYRSADELRQMLAAVDKYGLKLTGVYVPVVIEKDQKSSAEKLKEAFELLKGRDALVMIPINSKTYKKSTPDGDETAAALLREASDAARECGLRLALYPHLGSWVERVEDAVRVADKTDRPNVGVMFNLCHWLRVDGKDVEARLKAALPRLFAVTINGADADGKDWSTLIQTLDRGSYDVGAFVRTLTAMGYTGPIGLQHYGIKGDAHENLKRSMDAWRRICASMESADKRD